MAKPTRYFYLIARDQLTGWPKTGAPVEGVLDMLRYDYARIEPNAPEGFYLLSADHPPGVERWASFGVRIAWIGHDPYEAALAAPKLRKT